METSENDTKNTCKHCDKSFSTPYNLKVHIESIHEGVKPYQCKTCDRGFDRKNIGSYKRHVQNCSGKLDDTDWKCNLCQETFKAEPCFFQHLKDSHNNQCPETSCAIVFGKIHALKKHYKSKHLGITYDCEICGKKLTRKLYLRQHMESFHEDVLEPEVNIDEILDKPISPAVSEDNQCNLCDLSFSSKIDFNRHVDLVHLKLNQNPDVSGNPAKRGQKRKIDDKEDDLDDKDNNRPKRLRAKNVRASNNDNVLNESGTNDMDNNPQTWPDMAKELDSFLDSLNRIEISETDETKFKVAKIRNLIKNAQATIEEITGKSCKLCDQSFPDMDALKKHVLNDHVDNW